MLYYIYLTTGVICGAVTMAVYPPALTASGFWIGPLVALGVWLGLILLHLLVLITSAYLVNTEKHFTEQPAIFKRFVEQTLAMVPHLCGTRLHLTGFDKVPDDRRFFFVCNHRSNFDPLLELALIGKKGVVFVSKAENYDIPIFGRLMKAYGTLGLVREDDRSGVKMIIDATNILKKDQASIAIYPEGWSNLTEDVLLPLRSGAFKAPLKTKTPIVVATIQNSRHIARSILRGGCHVYFDVLRVIEPEEFEGLSTHEIADIVSAVMRENLEKEHPDRKIFKKQVPDRE